MSPQSTGLPPECQTLSDGDLTQLMATLPMDTLIDAANATTDAHLEGLLLGAIERQLDHYDTTGSLGPLPATRVRTQRG